MTPLLIENLKQIHAQSNNEDDREFLGAILKCQEADEAIAQQAEEMTSGSCGHLWPASMFDDQGRCPDCVLIWMHEYFSRKRGEAMINGW